VTRVASVDASSTVKAGIYLPGRGGVQIEDDVLATEDGAETLTTFTRELVSIPR
jgi:Xaa-Pro dipeptidase